jgi:hypothetical protein
MHTNLLENLKGRNHLGDIGIDGGIILKWIITLSLPCPTKVGYALSPLRYARMPREGMLKISIFCLLQVKRNVP